MKTATLVPRRFFKTGAVAALFLLAAGFAHRARAIDATGKKLTLKQIVDLADYMAYYQGKSGRAKVHMVITDSQGRTRTREFTMLRLDETPKGVKDQDFIGEQKFYVYFLRPADVNKMVFMVWKHLDRDDDRWLYLPALDLVKRIAATDKRTSFVGSNFFYEDVSGRNLNEDKHELVKTTDKYYLLKHIPKNPDSVEFSYYLMWVDRKTMLPVKTEYFDKNGRKYRVYEANEIKTIQGYPTVTKMTMSDLNSGGKTVITYTEIKYNIRLPEKIFTERYLRRAPRRYLR